MIFVDAVDEAVHDNWNDVAVYLHQLDKAAAEGGDKGPNVHLVPSFTHPPGPAETLHRHGEGEPPGYRKLHQVEA